MKKKSKEWIDASINKISNKQIPFLSNFVTPKCSIVGSKEGYKVIATEELYPGDIIEEVPVLGLHTTVQDLVESGEDADPIIASYGIFNFSPKKEFEKEGNPIVIGLGNFNIYKKSSTANAIHTYDTNFNIISIRAIDHIQKGSEIFLFRESSTDASTTANKKEKSMGCGCGKKKNQQQKPQEHKKEEPKQETQTTNSTFKSMVDGKELKSIKVD